MSDGGKTAREKEERRMDQNERFRVNNARDVVPCDQVWQCLSTYSSFRRGTQAFNLFIHFPVQRRQERHEIIDQLLFDGATVSNGRKFPQRNLVYLFDGGIRSTW
jgi:hypothetical protein